MILEILEESEIYLPYISLKELVREGEWGKRLVIFKGNSNCKPGVDGVSLLNM